MIIAIDGPSASGKSTIARRVAAEFGGVYVDSGALYRGITWKVLADGASPDKAADVSGALSALRIDFFLQDSAVQFSIDGTEPGLELRSEAVNESVSKIAAMPDVRKAVVGWLRDMVGFGDLVMEGRDIGTAVFPDAEHKFYLDASPEERARRRCTDEKRPVDAGPAPNEDTVRQSLERRDAMDSTRPMDPLQVADDATVIDSTGLEIDQTVELVLRALEGQRNRTKG
ncbi:(d)CMP kinase [Verrucomicrobiota bacterium]